MNPLNIVEAVSFTFKAVFVVALCYFINAWTSPGNWWAHWVLFGMSIAFIVKWASAIKTLVLLALVAGVSYWLYKRYGADARDRFNVWFAQSGAAGSARDVIARASGRGASVAP
jgi:hypothetical protein